MGDKTCRRCFAEKPISDFYVHKLMPDGHLNICKECVLERSKERYPEIKEARKEYLKRYRFENAERLKQYRKEHKPSRESAREKERKWLESNREKHNARCREWTRNNLLKKREQYTRRRALKLAAKGSHTAKEIRDLHEKQKGRCAICHAPIPRFHVDHITPLSRGGRNDIYNIQLLCQDCNLRKSDKDPILFMQAKGKLL